LATQTFKNVIGIIGQHIHPLKAQIMVEKYCSTQEISCNDFSQNNIPQFILFIAKERDSLCQVDDKKFYVLLSSLISYSKSSETSGGEGS
jgi:hypothetical protein